MLEKKNMIELKNLKKLRERAGLNQTELAAKLGVDARTIRRWEDGKNTPHRVYLKMLNRILGQL
jgi:DNA-binding transcriptional regulator YiaG